MVILKIEHRSLTLGEVLDGDRMAKSMYDIKFRINQEQSILCNVELNEKDLEKLKMAIEDLYYFEFVVGIELNVDAFFIFLHLHLHLHVCLIVCFLLFLSHSLLIVCLILRRLADARIYWSTRRGKYSSAQTLHLHLHTL